MGGFELIAGSRATQKPFGTRIRLEGVRNGRDSSVVYVIDDPKNHWQK
jgi:hypothetical protein